MLSWIVDQIPLWVYVAVAIPLIGGAFYFASPILVPLWNLTPRWVKVAGGVILAIGSAFVLGRNKGARDAKELQRRNDAQAIDNRREIDHEVQNLDVPAVDKRLDKWLRDDK